MQLISLRTYFKSELLGYYPDTEISSFFYLLAENILKWKRIDIALNLGHVISGNAYNRFQTAIERLKNYEPVQYILGETEFYGLRFTVNKNVLIPRPETEELVDWVIKKADKAKTLNILDIGTGSGCIAISLAKNLSNAKICALDVCPEALKVAKENATQNKVRVDFIETDILNTGYTAEFDIIVANPPYIRQLEKAEIQKNVLENEPHLALFVKDNDALLFYEAICQFAVNNLTRNGLLFFEINEYLGQEIIMVLEQYGFKDIQLKKDVFNKDRMIKAIKNV